MPASASGNAGDSVPNQTAFGETRMGITPVAVARPATEPAPFVIDSVEVPGVRAAIAEIARAGYSETAVRERLGLNDIAELQWKALPIYRRERLYERDALAVAIDLFLLQGTVPAAELERLLSTGSSEVLLGTGILA